MDVEQLAARMKRQMRAEYLRGNIRILNPRRVDRTGGVTKFDVIDALKLLGEQKVLTRKIHVDCPHAHTMWASEVSGEQPVVGDPESEAKWLDDKLHWPYECRECDEGLDRFALADLYFRVYWCMNKKFEADIDLWVKQAEFVECHVDTGAAPRTVALSVGRAATPVPLLPQDVEEFIRELIDAGRLVRDMATGFVYVAMWYPKTIQRVREANEAFLARGGTP